ncbi:MAG: cyclophane-forming radical SAM/SPASM peptide maturase GrrM/OscB [Isosphaeraceae bacterium]
MAAYCANLEMEVGPLELLVLQPTPFCNIDCSYCYLPDRVSRARMSPEVLGHVFDRVFSSNLVRNGFTVVWHAGEPLVLPVAFYERALSIIRDRNTEDVQLDHSFQSNGTLITQEWCDFIKGHPVRIGVSLDGPAFLHDAYRKTRQGNGTHSRVMEGVRLLLANGISFHVIAVLTKASLDYPDEIFEFFEGNQIRNVGFNIEEIEGPHQSSSLQSPDMGNRYARFLSRFFDLAADSGWPLRVREFDTTQAAVLQRDRWNPYRTSETTPYSIISVDWQGNFSTFSPELLGLSSPHYGDFVLGNVAERDFDSARSTSKFQAIHADILAGVRRCEETCSYFSMCGGGAPVNKYFENGSFVSTETLFCVLNRKALLDVVLDKLEQGAFPTCLPAASPRCISHEATEAAGVE